VRQGTIRVALLLLACSAMFVAQPPLRGPQTCTNGSIAENYGLWIQGTQPGPGGANPSFYGAATLTADGNGVFTGSGTFILNGQASSGAVSGSYSVNTDCTGQGTIQYPPGQSMHIGLMVTNGGQEVDFIQSDTGALVIGTLKPRQASCSVATLNGTYEFLSGTWHSDANAVSGESMVAEGIFDGAGGLSLQVSADEGGSSGTPMGVTGQYTVNADCTGSISISGTQGDWKDIVVVYSGREIDMNQSNGTDTPSGTVFGTRVFAPNRILPQFAFGGGWYSALYFTNTSNSAVSFPVSFVGNDGTPLNVPSVGATSTTVNLAPWATAIIEAPNVGPLVQGYVVTSLPNGVSGHGIFRQSVPGIPDQEAVVPLSDATTMDSTLIWDDTDGAVTAVAVANPSAVPVTVSVTAWDSSGNIIGTSSITLAANAKTAAALYTLPGLSGMTGKRGCAEFTVISGNVVLLGLRFRASAFTSIPTADR
jgi:hypothetical protein